MRSGSSNRYSPPGDYYHRKKGVDTMLAKLLTDAQAAKQRPTTPQQPLPAKAKTRWGKWAVLAVLVAVASAVLYFARR